MNLGLFMYSALLFVMQLYLTSSIVYEIIMISVFIPQLIYNFKYQVLNLNPIIFIELMGMKLFYFVSIIIKLVLHKRLSV